MKFHKSDFNNATKPVERHLNRFYCYLQMEQMIKGLFCVYNV